MKLPEKWLSDSMKYIAMFPVGDRFLYLFWNTGRTDGCPFSLYYEFADQPIQHNMGDCEAFRVLQQEFEKAEQKGGELTP